MGFPYLFSGLIAFLLLHGAANAAEPPVLTLTNSYEPPYTTQDGKGFLDIVAGEAFRRAGVQLRLVKVPAERALINANAGIEDGDLARIAGLEEMYPNLIRVPEKLLDFEFSAFSRDPSISGKVASFHNHAVGYIKGWKIYENMVAGATNVVTVEDPAQLFRLLDMNRIEIALYARWVGLKLIQEQGLKGIKVLEPPLAKREMFIYLHKKHADLVPKIAGALQAMKRDGYYDRQYRKIVLAKIGPKRK